MESLIQRFFDPCLRGFLIALVLTAAACPTAYAGAWVQPKGGSFVKLSWFATRSSERAGPDGSSMPADPSGGDYVEQMLYGYFEYGLITRLSLLGSFAYKDMTVEAEPEFGTRSTGDLRLGGRWGLVQGPKALALEGIVSIPTYPASDLSQPPGQREQNLPAGTGQTEAELRVLGGMSLYPLPLYANLDLGYRVRGGGFSDQWLGVLEFGGGSPSFFSKVELRGLGENGDIDSDLQVGGVSVAERSLRLNVEASVRPFSAVWVGGGYSAHLAGRNTLTGGQWQLFFAFIGRGS